MSEDASFVNFHEEADVKVRSEMLDEALEILAGLWSAKPFRFEGKYYKVAESTFFPPPVQKPRIPIWIGGGWPRNASPCAPCAGTVHVRSKWMRRAAWRCCPPTMCAK